MNKQPLQGLELWLWRFVWLAWAYVFFGVYVLMRLRETTLPLTFFWLRDILGLSHLMWLAIYDGMGWVAMFALVAMAAAVGIRQFAGKHWVYKKEPARASVILFPIALCMGVFVGETVIAITTIVDWAVFS